MTPPEQQTEERQEKPKEREAAQTWESWECTVRQIYGDARQRLEDQPVKSQSPKETFYSRDGSAVTDLQKSPADQPLLGATVDTSGRAVVRMYRNRQDAESGKPSFEQTFEYSTSGTKSTESRTIRVPGQDKGETKLETTFDASNMHLSFKVDENGKNQAITLDADSKPVEFKVKSGDRELEYKIKDGKLVGASVNGVAVEGKQLAEFLKAGESSLQKLRESNGIPEPLSEAQPRAEKGDQKLIAQLERAERQYDQAGILHAVKQFAALEDSSTGAKQFLDDYAKKGKLDEAGRVQYARMDRAGGPTQVLEALRKEENKDTQAAMLRAAATDLRQIVADGGRLTPDQIALAAEAKLLLNKERSENEQRDFDRVIRHGISTGSADTVASKLLDAVLKSGGTDLGGNSIGTLYIDALRAGINKDQFAKQFEKITEEAKKGNISAIPLLICMTAGVAQNYNETGKDAVADKAAKSLREMASSDRNLAKEIASAYAVVTRDKWVRDENKMMETLGKMSKDLPEASEQIRTQANEYASQPESAPYKSAVKGLVELGKQGLWKPEDVQAMLSNVNKDVAAGVKTVFANLDQRRQQEVFQRLEEIAQNDTLPLEKRQLAAEIFKAVDKFATDDQKKSMQDLRLGDQVDSSPPPQKVDKPKTAEDLVDLFRLPDKSQITEADMPRVNKLLAQIDSPNALERENSALQLAAYGPAIVPLLTPIAGGAQDGETREASRARAVIRSVTDRQAPVISEKLDDFLLPETGKKIDPAKLEEAIKALDLMAQNPHFGKQRKEYLEGLAAAAKNSPEEYERIQKGLQELGDLNRVRADLRIKLAGHELESGDKDASCKLLTEAVTINPSLVRAGTFSGDTATFSTVYVAAGGAANKGLSTTIEKAGGKAQSFAPRTTASLEKSAARDDGKLKIEEVIDKAKSVFQEYEARSKPHMDPAARATRMAEIMRDPNPEKRNEVVGLAVDQYKAARNDYERQQSIDALKVAVQNGNQYALEAMQKLATLDAAMRLSDSQQTLNSALASKEQKGEATKRRDDALLDLARHEYAERQGRSDEQVGDNGGVLEHLAKGAAPGITGQQVAKAREQVKQEADVRQHQVSVAVARIAGSSGASREAALADLEKLALDQIGKEFQDSYNKSAFVPMKDADAVRRILDNLDNPKCVADALFELKTNRDRGFDSGLLYSLRELQPDGKQLIDAVERGDREAVERIVVSGEMKAALSENLGPRDQLAFKLASLKPADVLKALQEPEKLDELLRVATEEAKANQKIVDGLINDYLLRTTPGKPVMEALKNGLPPEGQPFSLKADTELREKIQSAIDLEHLPRTVVKHAQSLLDGASLNAEEVKELRRELNKTESQRRADALAMLNKMSFDNLQTTYKFESVVKQLEGLEQAQDTRNSIKAASKLFDPDSPASPADKQKAAKDVVSRLEKLCGDMTVDHAVSRDFRHALEVNLAPRKGGAYDGMLRLEALTTDLKSGDEERIASALKTLDDNMPDATAKLDEYRAARIVRGLGPQSGPADYERVAKQLDAEIFASKSEGGQTNEAALDWSKWTKANETVSRITAAAASDNSDKAKEAVGALVKLAKDGNPYARAAVAAVLVGDQENQQIGHWMRNHGALYGHKQIYVPNFKSLPDQTRHELTRAASAGLLDISQTKKLTGEETSAMALALARASDSAGDKHTRENLTTALNAAVAGKNTKEVLAGIYEAIDSGVTGSKVLSGIYLKGAADPEFANHFAKFREFAKDYDKDLPNDRTEASLRILAGVSAGMADKNSALNPTDKNPAAALARKTLGEAAEVPNARSTVVAAMLDVHESGKSDVRFKDNNQLLSALGHVAARLGEEDSDQRAQALTEIRQVVTASAATADGAPHKSAVEGFFALAPHWQQSDVDVVKSTFTEAMFAGIQGNADKILPQHRTEIAAKLTENIKAPKGDIDFQTRLDSVRALSAFGKYLTVEQVSLLASFGGDKQYNAASDNVRKALAEYQLEPAQSQEILDAVANKKDVTDAVRKVLMGKGLTDEPLKSKVEELSGKIKAALDATKNGNQILADLGITGAQSELFKARVAEGLLHTLATAPYDTKGGIGPRELAFKAFRDLPWPIPTGEKTPDGQPVIIQSRDSAKLKAALITYFEGKPITRAEDLALSDQINRIVDNAKLPRPSALIVRNLGIEGGPIENRKEGDPPSVLQITEKIISNYSGPNRDGQDVLRQVVKNLEMVNALPGYRRAQVMGWTELSAEHQAILGKAEPSADKKRSLNWDSLTEAQKEAARWQDAARIPAQLVAGQMALNELQNSDISKKLLEPISDRIEKEMRATSDAIWDEKHEIRILQAQKTANLDLFVAKTEKGANFGNQLVGFFTGDNGRDSKLNEEQTKLARSFGELTQKIAAREENLGRFEQDQSGMALSRDVATYAETLNKGDRVKADQMAVGMWREHGPMMSQLAPGIWRDLTMSSDTTLQGASLLKRLHDRKQAHWDSIPGYTSGDNGPGKPFDRQKSNDGFREALGLKAAFGSPDESRGLLQLKTGEKLLDTAAMRTHMLGRVDADPVLAKFSNQSRKMGEDLNELNKMFGAAMKGAVYEDSIAVMKEKAQRVKEGLNGDSENPITRQDLTDLAERITTMEQALAEMKKDPSSHNKEAKDALETRVKTFKGMHNLFNKFEDVGWDNPRYKDVEGAVNDKDEPVNQNKQINEMLKRILDGGLTPSTFTSWCKENALLIGVTVAACAATVAACATFGISSPAAVGLWVAVVGLAAREVTNEVLFQVNRDGYTGWGSYDNKGSRIGNWNREAYGGKFKDVDDAMWHLLKDVGGQYALEIARDWAAFVLTAGIMNRVGGMGTSESVKALFRVAPPRNVAQLAFQAERMALAESQSGLGPVAQSYMRQFMREFGRELLVNSGFATAHLGLETSVHKAIGRETVEKMGEWGQFGLSFALSTGLAMGQGAAHSRIFRSGSFEPGAKFKFNLAEGVTEGQMVKYMNQQGLNVKQTSVGRWEVLPVGAKAGMNPIVMENVASRGEGRPSAELHPEGHPPGKEARGPLEQTVPYKDGEWKQTPAGEKILKEIGEFTDHFVKPNNEGFDAALKVATNPEGLPPGTKITAVDPGVTFDAKAFNAASPAQRRQMMETYLEQISGASKLADGGKTANYADVVIKVGDHTFNLASGEHVGSTAPPKDVATTFDTFRNSDAGKRLLQEQAIHAMEERLHLQHEAMGNKAFSPSYVKFLQETGQLTADHLNGKGRSDGSENARASLERELIFALHDKGWSVEQLKHHFGDHHSKARHEAFEFLERGGISRANDGKDVVGKALTPERRAELARDIASKLGDDRITKGQFEEIFKGMSDSDRALALRLVEDMMPNMNTRNVDQQLQALGKKLREWNLNKESEWDSKLGAWVKVDAVTVFVLNSSTDGNLLAQAFQKNTGVRARVEVLEGGRLAQFQEGLAEINKIRANIENLKLMSGKEGIIALQQDQIPALLKKYGMDNAVFFDNPANARPEQLRVLQEVKNLLVPENGFNTGLNFLDVSTTQLTQNTATMQQKVSGLVDKVKKLEAAGVSHDEAVKQALAGDTNKLLPNATRFDSTKDVATKKEARAAVAGDDAKYKQESIFTELSKPGLTPQQVEAFLGRLNAEHQLVAARMLRDGVNWHTYKTMMEQSQKLHKNILETVPGKDPSNMLILTGLEANSSANAVNSLYARANSLAPDNFVSVKELHQVRQYLKAKNPGEPSPEVKATMDKLKGKRLVYIDDYANSGSQIPKLLNTKEQELFSQLVTRDGKRLISEITVGTLGRHETPVNRNPWSDQTTYPNLKLSDGPQAGALKVNVAESPAIYNDVLSKETYQKLFQTPPPGMDLNTYTKLMTELGSGKAIWQQSSVRTAVMTPYGGANNNVPLVQALAEMNGLMGLPRRFPSIDEQQWWRMMSGERPR